LSTATFLQGQNTMASDVWSFAVTMWEVLGHASRRPFEWMTDAQVLDNCRRHRCHSDGDDVRINPPPCVLPTPCDECPREMYDLMRQCWARDPSNRPTFAEIQMFLARKNDGYRPQFPLCASSSLID
jgi:discoidin domain receptor family member 2